MNGLGRLVLWALVSSAPMAAHAAERHGTFARAPCPANVAPEKGLECGVLTVPERRDVPGGRMIRLPVAVYRSQSPHPAPDPVIFLPGGPGGSALAHPLPVRDNPFLAERDYILLEPRGAQLAQPALECPGMNALEGVIAAGRLAPHAQQAAWVKAATACRETLSADGVDLRGYTSAETAQDIEDLRQALGYARWNLFGHSYGTRLALTVLRDHPDGVRSVMLDSALPVEVNFDESATGNLRRTLAAVWSDCASDPVCGRRHPHPDEDLQALLARAERQPLRMSDVLGPDGRPVTVGARQVVEALYLALHDPSRIGRVPVIVADSLEGHTEELARLVKANQGPSSFAWGLRLSVWCQEEMPFEDAGRVDDQLSPAWGLAGIDERAAFPAVCRAWDVPPASPLEKAPVASQVPVLVLAGQYDPDTPPHWGRLLLVNLPNARMVVFPGRSHGAGFNRCGAEIEVSFLHAPTAPLPLDCVMKMRGADFGAEPARTSSKG